MSTLPNKPADPFQASTSLLPLSDPPVTLLRTIARMFYSSPKQLVLLELFLHCRMMTEDQAAKKLLLSNRETAKLLAGLRENFLLASEPWQEKRKSATTKSTLDSSGTGATINGGTEKEATPTPNNSNLSFFIKTYYYIDWPLMCNAVRWRVMQMAKQLEEEHARDASVSGAMLLECGQCKRRTDALHASHDPRRMAFVCEFCDAELNEVAHPPPADGNNNNGREPSSVSASLYERFNVVMRPVKELLAKCDRYAFKPFDPKVWLTEYYRRLEMLEGSEPLAVEEDASLERGLRVTVEIAAEEHLALLHQEMPEWHSHSTLTGERLLESVSPSATAAASKRSAEAAIGEVEEELAREQIEEAVAALSQNHSLAAFLQKPSEESGIRVMVAGEPIPLSAITEADQERMTPEEYAAYYEALEQQQQQE